MNLTPFFDRGKTSSEVIRDRWREKVGEIPDALELTFTSDVFSAGEAINFRLEGRNEENLQIAATELRAELARYPGVFDITDSFRAGKQEAVIQVNDAGKNLGLTNNEVATQVRQAFYGAEAQRIQRGHRRYQGNGSLSGSPAEIPVEPGRLIDSHGYRR